MEAQTATVPATGEYYLQGVMETASGFKLNTDNSFEFFFSYGALDRSGAGHWKQEGNTIIFNSNKQQQDYTLLQSKKIPAKGITLQISGSNAQVNQLLYAIVKSGTKEETVKADSNGRMHFNMPAADSVVLLFEWCPDKRSVFAINNTAHNFFEFSIQPSLPDVVFSNFTLQVTAAGLEGAHPLNATKSFRYKRADKN
ncbi:hypothetical protein [Ferruginibacter profundus]